jgi:hypothetical protein
VSRFRFKAGLGGFYSNALGGITLPNFPPFLPADTTEVTATLDDGVWASEVVAGDVTRELNDAEKAAIQKLWDVLAVLQAPTPKYAVDGSGVFAGAVHDLTGLVEVPSAPPTPEHRWVDDAWVLPVDLAVLKEELLAQIDRTAGAARARYITVAPGQEATYVLKEQQANAFLADPAGEVPAYIAAEASATGMSPSDAATLISNTAKLWNEQLGPRIEELRRGGNLAVGAATTTADAQAAADNFIAQLEAV